MAYKLFIASVVVFAVFVQIQGKNPIDELEKLLHKLEEAVNKDLAKAQKSLIDAEAKVNATAAAVEKKSVDAMKVGEKKLEEKLNELKKEAAKVHINIDECLKGNEEKLLDLPNVLAEELVHCVSDNIVKEIKLVEDDLKSVQKLVDDVEHLKHEIEACKKEHDAKICYVKLATKIEKDLKLLAKIQADAGEVATLVPKLEAKIASCGTIKVLQFEKEGNEIFSTIAKCVEKKIHK